MGVLQSIPLCSKGASIEATVQPLELDKNNNDATITSQPAMVPPPEATSTPRPQSPTGLANDQYSDSLSSDPGGPPALSSGGDSGLEDSATDFEFSRPDHFEDTRGLDEDTDEDQEEIDLADDDRPPEPSVPDERPEDHEVPPIAKDETTRKISSLLSELVGDHPVGDHVVAAPIR